MKHTRRRLCIAIVSIVSVTLMAGCSGRTTSGAEEGTAIVHPTNGGLASESENRAPTTTIGPVAPADARANPAIGGNQSPPLGGGDPGKLSIVAAGGVPASSKYGPPTTAVPVVVRNNTSKTIGVANVKGIARDSSGRIVSSGDSQTGLLPYNVAPGQVAIGYVYFRSTLPPGATLMFTASGGKNYASHSPDVTEVNLVPGQYGSQQIVGQVKNNGSGEIDPPVGVVAVCFDSAGHPIASASGFLDGEDGLRTGETGSFTLDLDSSATCPVYLVAAEG